MLRGLVGAVPPCQELAPQWEAYRMVLLRFAMEEETQVEYLKIIHGAFGSFEQGHDGGIRGGPLAKLRQESLLDLLTFLRPFSAVAKSREIPDGSDTPEGLSKEREAFVAEYMSWKKTGSPVVAKHLAYSNAPSTSARR